MWKPQLARRQLPLPLHRPDLFCWALPAVLVSLAPCWRILQVPSVRSFKSGKSLKRGPFLTLELAVFDFGQAIPPLS